MLGLVKCDDENMLDQQCMHVGVSVELYYALTRLPPALAHLCVMQSSLNPQQV